ncbi:MAG: hypothetical protein A3A86_02680 [Elusimicrobia bacterium RIFCSPLOWO2_01_FULL_60_11]|nr:MAG: hypothetical protein A3A86_02680 [Elusimicrobia bacterium RIFCSPLOWO2_01_FULL_60_11]
MAVSPVGKNGQTVVPASIRKMFKVGPGHNLVGFYVHGSHVEIAPMEVTKVDYTEAELDRMAELAKEKGGRVFKTAAAAKKFMKTL